MESSSSTFTFHMANICLMYEYNYDKITLIYFYEARLEAMMLSNPTDCVIRDGICREHTPRHMLQIFSLKLAKLFVDSGPVELYGYIAVPDSLDPLLNYVVNLSRDDPIIVEQVHIHTYLQLFQ